MCNGKGVVQPGTAGVGMCVMEKELCSLELPLYL